MSAAATIARLNSSLANHGEDITIQRLTLAPGGVQIPFGVECRALVRGYLPNELVGGITQQDAKVILSPTQIIAAQWTSGRSANEDRRIPMKGNVAIIKGKPRKVEAADGIYVGDELARIEMRVLG